MHDHTPIDPMDTPSALVEAWDVLKRRKLMIVLTTAAAAGFAYYVTRLETPIYRAKATVEMLKPGNTLSIVTDWDIPNRGSAWQIRRTIRKRSLLDLVATRCRMRRGVQPAPPPKPQGRFAFLRPHRPTLDESLAMAASRLRVRQTDAAGIVDILCDSPDPALSAEYADTLIELYIQDDLKNRWVGAQYDTQATIGQLQDLSARLRIRQVQLQQYARESVLLSGGKYSIAADRLLQIGEALAKARAERARRQVRFELANSSPLDALSRVMDDSSLGALEMDLVAREGEKAVLLEKFTPRHESVRKLQVEIDQLQSVIDERRHNVVERLRNDYQAALTRENTLAHAYEAQSTLLAQESNKPAIYEQLRLDTNDDLSAYESLLKGTKLARVIAAVWAPNLRVVDHAEPPLRPYKPNMRRNVTIGIINGLFLAVALSLFRERADRTLHGPAEVYPSVHVPHVGAIPSGSVAPAKNQRGADLIAWWRERPVLSAAYRECAESILLRKEKGTVVMVASPRRNAGKTQAVANLGIAFAEMDRRVLLVDANVRSPRLHEFFGISNELGFADVLKEQGALQPYAIARSVHMTGIPRLFVLPGSRRRANLVSLLRDDIRLGLLLRTLRQDFDIVLLSAPALLEYADARLLATRADSALMVFRSGRTSIADGNAAVERLSRDGITILGAILNDCPRHVLSNSGYEDYREYSGAPVPFA
jgi:succinoglycan biosynthesis transport protein ExoP